MTQSSLGNGLTTAHRERLAVRAPLRQRPVTGQPPMMSEAEKFEGDTLNRDLDLNLDVDQTTDVNTASLPL